MGKVNPVYIIFILLLVFIVSAIYFTGESQRERMSECLKDGQKSYICHSIVYLGGCRR